MRTVMVLAGALALAGCATTQWVRPGATAMEFDTDKAQCQYEATLGTPGSNLGRGMSGAIASGIADGMRMVELQTLCLQARGWQRQTVASN